MLCWILQTAMSRSSLWSGFAVKRGLSAVWPQCCIYSNGHKNHFAS